MAEWENIPRLDPALQDEIDNVQLKHNALVEAVRGYSGGSIAGKTNEVMDTHQDNLDTVATREKSLVSAIGQPEPAPSMLLDFASQTYFTGVRGLEQGVDPHEYLNVSRATPKWVMGPQGKLVEVPPNTLAYEYDSETGEPLGVLIEGSRTNLIASSDDLTSGGWTINGIASSAEGGKFSTTSLVDGRIATEIDGTSITSDGRVQAQFSPQGVDASVGGATSTFSAYVLKNTGGVVRISVYATRPEIHSVNGSIDTESGAVTSGYPSQFKVEDAGSAWRISLTSSLPEGLVDSSFKLIVGLASTAGSPIVPAGNAGRVVLWGMQFERGSTASSYIPTTDSPVTRASDRVLRTLGGEFNPSEGTFYVVIDEAEGDIRGVLSLPDVSMQTLIYSNEGSRYVAYDGNDSLVIQESAVKPPGIAKIALTYKDGVWTGCANGVIGGRRNMDFTGRMLALGYRFGSLGESTPKGFKSLEYYPYAMTEQELQELTANG